MSANRDCAEVLLSKLSEVADRTKGGKLAPEAGATMAVAFALLDVADAIREQTAEIHAQTAVMLNEGILVHEGGLER